MQEEKSITDPQIMTETLFNAGGGTRAGLTVAKEGIEKDKVDPIVRAREEAKRGILSNALEWVNASSLPPIEKIKLFEDLAATVGRGIVEKTERSPIDNRIAIQATAVMIGSQRFLTSTGQPLKP